MERKPHKRLIGTDPLTTTYRQDTPGECKKNVRRLSSHVNEVKVNNLVDSHNTHNSQFVIKNNVQRIKLSEAIKDKVKKIKNQILLHPPKHHTEHKIIRHVHENKKQIACESRNIYDETKRGNRYMAEHNRGGGKKREGLEGDSANHIINQLRIVKNLRDLDGTPITFDNDQTCLVDHKYAKQALELYERVEKPSQKEVLASRLSHSPRSFLTTVRQSDEHLISELEDFIKERKRGKKITIAERVEPALSSHRLEKVTLEDDGRCWVSKLYFNDKGSITATSHIKEDGIVGLNKVRQHLQENIANYYNVPFEDKT